MDQNAIVERMGLYFGATGRTPMRGRVFGYLLCADPKRCDFKSIREAIDASKSAVSLALTGLGDQGLVRSFTRPGKRKRYFQVDVPGWLERSKGAMRDTVEFNEILRACQAARADEADVTDQVSPTAELADMIRFHDAFLAQIEAFIATWEAGRPR